MWNVADMGRRGGPRLFTLLIGIGGLIAAAYAITDGAFTHVPLGLTGLIAGGAVLMGLLIMVWTIRPSTRR
jgi:hypothetical protein